MRTLGLGGGQGGNQLAGFVCAVQSWVNVKALPRHG